MNNFDQAINASQTSLDSFGSAEKENEAYMESLEAKTNLLKATFQDLSNNVVNSEMVGNVLDLANAFLQLVNTPIGIFVTQMGLLSGVLLGAGTIASKVIPKIIGVFKNGFGSITGTIKNFTDSILMTQTTWTSTENVLTVGLTKIGDKIAKFFTSPLGYATMGITAFTLFKSAIDDVANSTEDAVAGYDDSISESEAKIEELKQKMSETHSSALIKSYQEQISELQGDIDSFNAQKLATILNQKEGRTTDTSYKSRATVTGEMPEQSRDIDKLIDKYKQLREAQDFASFAGDTSAYEKQSKALGDVKDQLDEYYNAILEAKEAGVEFDDNTQAIVDALLGLTDANGQAIYSMEELTDSIQNVVGALDSAKTAFEKSIDIATEFANTGTLSFDTLSELSQIYGELPDFGDYFEKLWGLMSDGKLTSEELGKALSEMDAELLAMELGSGDLEVGLERLATADEKLIASMLESAEVANADEVAKQLVANANEMVASTAEQANTSEEKLMAEKSPKTGYADKLETANDKVKSSADNANDSLDKVTKNRSANTSWASTITSALGRINTAASNTLNKLLSVIGFKSSGTTTTTTTKNSDGTITVNGVKHHAKGTSGATKGWALVGEEGPELVKMGGGETVLTNKQTMTALANGLTGIEGYADGVGSSLTGGMDFITPSIKSSTSTSSTNTTKNTTETTKNTTATNSNTQAKKQNTQAQKDTTTATEDATDAIKEQAEAFEEEIDVLEHRLTLLQKNNASTEEQIAVVKQALQRINEIANWYRSQGYSDESEEIRNLQNQWWDFYEQIAEIQQDAYEERIDILDHQLYLAQKNGKSEQEQIKILQQMLTETHDMADWYRSQGYAEESEEIRNLQKEWWEYHDTLEEIYEDIEAKAKQHLDSFYSYLSDLFTSEKDDLVTLFDAISDKAQDEIDALEKTKEAEEEYWDAQIDALKEANDETEEQIKLQELLEAKAKAQATKKFVFKDGRFQYLSDTDEIAKAQEELDSYNREKQLEVETQALENQKEKAISAIDDQIESWEEYKESWANIVSDYEEEQDRLMIAQKYGIDLEAENWETRINNVEDFVERYRYQMQQLSDIQEASAEESEFDYSTEYASGMTAEDMIAIEKAKYDYANATTDAERAKAHADAEAIRAKYGFSGGVAGDEYILLGSYANGTTNAKGGLSLVGEAGAELRVLNSGDGIIPARATNNLLAFGKDPSGFLSNFSGNTVNVSTLSLPNIRSGNDAEALIKNLKSLAQQYSKKRI